MMDEKAIEAHRDISRFDCAGHRRERVSYDQNLVDYLRKDILELRPFARCAENSHVNARPQEVSRQNRPALEGPKLAPLRSQGMQSNARAAFFVSVRPIPFRNNGPRGIARGRRAQVLQHEGVGVIDIERRGWNRYRRLSSAEWIANQPIERVVECPTDVGMPPTACQLTERPLPHIANQVYADTRMLAANLSSGP